MEHRFELVVTGAEHGTWQGLLRTGESAFLFRSELELLLELERQLNALPQTEPWKRTAGKS